MKPAVSTAGTDRPRLVKVGTAIATHTHGFLQVRSTYWTSTEPREPVVLLGDPADPSAPPVLVVSLKYARRLLATGVRRAASRVGALTK